MISRRVLIAAILLALPFFSLISPTQAVAQTAAQTAATPDSVTTFRAMHLGSQTTPPTTVVTLSSLVGVRLGASNKYQATHPKQLAVSTILSVNHKYRFTEKKLARALEELQKE